MSHEMTRYTKLKIALRWRLVGATCNKALAAFDLVEKASEGSFRKDKVTPSFLHQLEIANYALTLGELVNYNHPDYEHFIDDLLAVIFLHDHCEDHDYDRDLLKSQFGANVAEAVWCMTKKYKGIVKNPDQVFSDISNNLLASLAKGCDRINNFQSMAGVFTREKQLSYIEEGKHHFLPMLKHARKRFVALTNSYLNIETMLKYQIELLTIINTTKDEEV